MIDFRTAGLVALVGVGLAAAPLAAQATAGPEPLSAQDRETREMSLTLGVGCNPRRHNSPAVQGSESIIRRGDGALTGTATFFSNIDGTFLVLEDYDAEYNGHCLVFGWFGGPVEAGRYPVARLAHDTVMDSSDGERPFFGMSMVRTPSESSLLLVEAGSLEIEDVGAGVMSGTFELSGLRLEGDVRVGAVSYTGSFRAQEGEGQ